MAWDLRLNSCANRIDVGTLVGRLRVESDAGSAVAWFSESGFAWRSQKFASSLLCHLVRCIAKQSAVRQVGARRSRIMEDMAPTGTRIRQAYVTRGQRLEYFTIAYNSLEGLTSIVAGLIAGSVSLLGFGLDSMIEVASGAALLRRLRRDQ